MLKLSLLPLCFMLLAAAPANDVSAADAKQDAQSGGSQAAVSPAAKPAAPAEKKICKNLPSSYSHMSDRVCLTPSEWKQVEADLKE